MKSYAILLAALFQVFGSSAPMAFNWGQSISEQSAEASSIITPPGYAFSIWGPIFLACFIYGLYAVKNRNKLPDIVDKVGWLSVAMFVTCGAWGLWVPFNGTDIVSFIIISAGAALGMRIMYIIGSPKKYSNVEKGTVVFPLSLLAGWLITATTVSVLGTANYHNITLVNTDAFTTVLPLLLVLISLVMLTLYKTKNYFYALAPVWGLGTLSLEKLMMGEVNLGVAAAAGALLILVTGVCFLVKKS
jgi:hypothetical protein